MLPNSMQTPRHVTPLFSGYVPGGDNYSVCEQHRRSCWTERNELDNQHWETILLYSWQYL